MAKKLAPVAAPLSLEDEMVELANQILSERLKIKQATDNLKEKEDKLKTYLQTKGETTCGVMQIEEVAGSVHWVSDLKGKRLDTALGRIMAAIDKKYIVMDIDKKAVFNNIKSDYALIGLLKTEGIDIAQKEGTTRLKEIKVNG
jgi:hypothetical protein